MKTILQEATSADNVAIEEALTEYNIKIISTLPRAESHKLDFSLKSNEGLLIGGINAEYTQIDSRIGF